jgi:hypothetical protein
LYRRQQPGYAAAAKTANEAYVKWSEHHSSAESLVREFIKTHGL